MPAPIATAGRLYPSPGLIGRSLWCCLLHAVLHGAWALQLTLIGTSSSLATVLWYSKVRTRYTNGERILSSWRIYAKFPFDLEGREASHGARLCNVRTRIDALF